MMMMMMLMKAHAMYDVGEAKMSLTASPQLSEFFISQQ